MQLAPTGTTSVRTTLVMRRRAALRSMHSPRRVVHNKGNRNATLSGPAGEKGSRMTARTRPHSPKCSNSNAPNPPHLSLSASLSLQVSSQSPCPHITKINTYTNYSPAQALHCQTRCCSSTICTYPQLTAGTAPALPLQRSCNIRNLTSCRNPTGYSPRPCPTQLPQPTTILPSQPTHCNTA